MQEYNKSNKISSVLWLKSSITRFNFKYYYRFRIKLKPREGVVKFPKYYKNNPTLKQIENENNINEYSFKWNEKVFSRWEFNHFSEPNNCVLENEKEYNLEIQNDDYKVSQMYTNLDKKKALSVPKGTLKNNSFESSLIQGARGILTKDISNSCRHLFKSELNMHENDDNCQAMHIVWDNSEYNEDSQLLFKEEVVLLSLYYNPAENSLLVSPRENDILYNPYDVHTDTGVFGFQYAVNIEEEKDDDEELIALLNKLNSKLEKKKKNILRFQMPPLGKNMTTVHFEIVTAKNFDHNNVYVEFTLKVPDEIECTGELNGRTHVSQMINEFKRWNFGHVMDLELEYANGIDPPPITIYFEAISVDWWGRYRTEGYAHIKITPSPGKYEEVLPCRRPEELDKREAERRRFFVGECHLIKDLRVLDHPQEYDMNFRYISTGDITVRWNTITQAHSSGSLPSLSPGSASRLLQGADDALQQYSRAKATLASATEDLDTIYGSGDR